MNEFFNVLSYAFIQRALIVGVLISLCSALLGVNLVLKRYSMIGDGLSHVGFGALAIAAAAGLSPLPIAIIIVIISAILLLKMTNSGKIKGESAIAVISASALAIGVITVSVTGSNTDLSNYMFGSILAISNFDAVLTVILSIIIIVIYILFYNRIFAITFDEDFAKATGVKVSLFNTVLAILTAVTVVVGMRLMGALLVSSLIIFPPLCAIKLCKNFKGVTVLSAILSIVSFLAGLFLSYVLSFPTGATIVITNLILLILSLIIKAITNKINLKKSKKTL
ncbi:MAG: metal ABC transporter permease [Ruminococcaceae bacterium]|nr:metal ABC transporter permease [Oscillospiraceae bacterium]